MHYLHTKLTVRDLTAAIAFYEAALACRVRARRPGPGSSEIAFLTLPGDAAELQLSQRLDVPFEAPPPGLVHLAFRVEDLDVAMARATAAGASVLTGPYVLPSGSRVAFLRDLDGYDLELVQKAG